MIKHGSHGKGHRCMKWAVRRYQRYRDNEDMAECAESRHHNYEDGYIVLLLPHCSSEEQTKQQHGDLEKDRK